MRFASVNGIVLHHALEGPEGAPALVFSNSLGTDFRIWDRVLARLGPRLDRRLRVLRYDKRGHGLSGCPPAPYRLADHVADLRGLLEHLGIGEAVIVGLSVGGMIAQGLAQAAPGLLRGLVLCDTAHRIGTPEMWNERIAAIEAGGIEALAEPILERWFSAAFRAERPAELAGWRAMLTRTPVQGYLGTCAALRDADLTEAAKAIAVPTLCLGGSEDGATPPELVGAMAALIPGARHEVIAGAGHLPCIEKPEAVAGLIGDLLGSAGLV